MIKVTMKDHKGHPYEVNYDKATRYQLESGVFHLLEGSVKQVGAIPAANVISLHAVTTVEIEHQVVINGNVAVNGSIDVSPAGRGRVIAN